jgi:hypothetical protein
MRLTVCTDFFVTMARVFSLKERQPPSQDWQGLCNLKQPFDEDTRQLEVPDIWNWPEVRAGGGKECSIPAFYCIRVVSQRAPWKGAIPG